MGAIQVWLDPFQFLRIPPPVHLDRFVEHADA